MKKQDKIIAQHLQQDNNHQVMLKSLHVVMCQDDGLWFAQGLEIDYAAYGASVEQAKKHFESGMVATIHEHLKMYGTLEKFFKPAPEDEWKPTYSKTFNFASLSVHKIEDESSEFHNVEEFPFDIIAYSDATASCAA